MKKLSNSLDRKVVNLALETARSEFIIMISPGSRGPNWDWNNFPEWVEERVERRVRFTSYLTDKQRQMESVLWWARYYGRNEANHILTMTEVCRWGKNVV